MVGGGGFMLRSCLFRLLSMPLLVLALIGVHEAMAVHRAQLRTPAVLASVAQRPLKLTDFPEDRRAALIAVEDPGFYRHMGLDFATPGAGLTTITQALVKRLYFDQFAPGFARIEQSLIARFALDGATTKDDQLEIFINYASFGMVDGHEVIGFPAAANIYYDRAFDELSRHEYLSLVAMLIAPNALDPRDHPVANARRVHRIEALLAGRCKPANLFDVRYGECASS